MAWEFAAIVLRQPRIGNISNENGEERAGKWVLVSPGKISHPPRVHYELKGSEHTFEKWESPVAKCYWEFSNIDEENFIKRLSYLKKKYPGVKKWSIKGKTRKTHFESSDLLSLINEAGKEGWEITGGIGLADGQPETRYRMMRREI